MFTVDPVVFDNVVQLLNLEICHVSSTLLTLCTGQYPVLLKI